MTNRSDEQTKTAQPSAGAAQFWRSYYSNDPNFPPSEAACKFAEAYACAVNRELLEALDELSSAIQDGLRRYAGGDPNAIASNMISATLRQAENVIQKASKS